MIPRFLVAAVLACIASTGMAQQQVNGVPIAKGAKVEVVFYTADDCKYCTQWKQQSKASALEDMKKSRVAFHEIGKARIKMPYQESHYPAEAKFAWDQVKASGKTNFVIPRWTIYADHQPVMTGIGTGDWSKVSRFLGDVVAARDGK